MALHPQGRLQTRSTLWLLALASIVLLGGCSATYLPIIHPGSAVALSQRNLVIVVFGLMLFATYGVMAGRTAGGPSAAGLFDLTHVFAETMLLLASSFTFGLASLAADDGRTAPAIAWLAVTFALGLGFVAMDLTEFSGIIAEGPGPQRSGFLSAFFTLVGTHGLHVTAGLVWIAVMTGQIAWKGLTGPVLSRLQRLGLFWHFLDIVWIGVFTFVYLAGSL